MRSIREVSRRTAAAALTVLLGLVTTPAVADTSLCCPADIVTDGTVGPGDLARMFSQWGASGDADLDGNGIVNSFDLAMLLDGWGDCPSPCLKTRLIGQVRFPDGSPATGAFVLSEFGGMATTIADGSFAFIVDVPAKASQLSVMATISVGSTDYAGEAVASPIVLDGETAVGNIVLEPEGCIPSWLPTVGSGSGTPDGQIWTMTTGDIGSGPMLFVGGSFTSIGGTPANNIAAWDGRAWRAFGSGVTGGHLGAAPVVFAIEAWDDGSGPQLFVGGRYLNAGGAPVGCVSRWNGTNWSSMGGGTDIDVGWITDFEVYDDGTGPALYASGAFLSIGGVNAQYIARWKSTGWSSVGNNAINNGAYALAVHDDGSGEKLYIGGIFEDAGPDRASAIASWDGTAWRRVGTADDNGNMDWGVYSMKSIQVGSESRLYIGGVLNCPGGQTVRGVGYWTGKEWAQVGPEYVSAKQFAIFPDESGPKLHMVGDLFSPTKGTTLRGVHRWNGETWETLQPRTAGAYALHTYDLGEGPELLIGGGFSTAIGSPVFLNGLARWNGQTLRTFGNSVENSALAMAEIPGPNGTEIVVGGSFTFAGGIAASRIARWDGTNWYPFAEGMSSTVTALAVHDAGSGPELYAAGSFVQAGSVSANRIARWDGAAWRPLGVGLGDSANALLSFDDGSGPKLYAAGSFNGAGGVTMGRIARWNGTSWEPVGAGFNGTVNALAVFNDGSGPKLYAGGIFTRSGGVLMPTIARWDGTAWGPVGSGTNGVVRALTVADTGDGPMLFVGGDFTQAGGTPAARIARWNGSTWSPLGTGVTGSVRAIASYPIDGQPAIVIGGDFTQAGGIATTRIAYWTGSAWGPLATGMDGSVNALLRRGQGADSTLFVSGTFTGSPSGDSFFSRLGCPNN